ncbi:MAG: nicotinate-nucleotide adenylyltransferase [Pseudomonadota bacterium]
MGLKVRCVALLGGSFDPVHQGHIAIATLFSELLQADELRIIPAGQPWQKSRLQATPADRIQMLRLAFGETTLPVRIDCQEIERDGMTYSIDTLRAIRAELGDETSIVFLLGADQLQHLDTWRAWRNLFDYAHICVAARPGFSLQDSTASTTVMQEFLQRAATLAEIRNTPHGLTYLAPDLALDISATEIRQALQKSNAPGALVPMLLPKVVLDYIQQHHLYKS